MYFNIFLLILDKEQKMKHDFHLMVNSKMKREIIKISKKLNKSISSTIVYIIKTLNSMLKRYHFIYPESKKDGKYKFINAKKHIHIYMNETDYRMIKHIYANMYIYSMAIIIRRMIEIYIAKVKEHGFDKFHKIMKRYDKMNKIKFGRAQKKWKKYDLFIQMSHDKSIKQCYKTIFTNNYALLGFEFT
jgi:hypothetical protein